MPTLLTVLKHWDTPILIITDTDSILIGIFKHLQSFKERSLIANLPEHFVVNAK